MYPHTSQSWVVALGFGKPFEASRSRPGAAALFDDALSQRRRDEQHRGSADRFGVFLDPDPPAPLFSSTVTGNDARSEYE